jgi:sirohydrochlorin ferrochelatase
MKDKRDIILLAGHGSRQKDTAGLKQVAHNLHTLMHPGCRKKCVRLAYLQFMKPTISQAIKNSVQAGAKRIIIHPFFLSKGVHVTKNIPELIKKARVMHPDVEFICTEPLGTHEQLADIVLASIKAVPGLKVKVKNKKDKK